MLIRVSLGEAYFKIMKGMKKINSLFVFIENSQTAWYCRQTFYFKNFMSFMVKISLSFGEGIDMANLYGFYKSNAFPIVLTHL